MNQWIFLSSYETVQKLLCPARSEWYNLGIALEVDPITLASIKKSNLSNCEDCFNAMLKSCSETNISLTWTGVCKALRRITVDRNDVAKSIEAMIRTKRKSPILRNDGNSEEGLKSESDA